VGIPTGSGADTDADTGRVELRSVDRRGAPGAASDGHTVAL
jgi:hypothetical protein